MVKNKVEIKDVQYLENGTLSWLGSNYESDFILNHAINYTTPEKFFTDYGKRLSIVVVFEYIGWSFGEIICSAFTYRFNKKKYQLLIGTLFGLSCYFQKIQR